MQLELSIFSTKDFICLGFFGKKPKNLNSFNENPESCKDGIIELGPGIVVIFI